MFRSKFTLGLMFLLLGFSGAAAQPRISVTVAGGSGAGSYRKGAEVHIWANPPGAGQVFDCWTGDAAELEDACEAHTKIASLKRAVGLTATYKAAPVWQRTRETVNGVDFGYYFPPGYKAVIFRFHGTGGGFVSFFSQTEERRFADDAVADGYAVVALESADRTNKVWDFTNPPATNRDLQNVAAIIFGLRSRGLLQPGKPLFALGFSNGGTFASFIATEGNWRAAAVYCSTGLDSWMDTTNVPHIWNLAANDTRFEAAGVRASSAQSRALARRGVAAGHNTNLSSPVYPERFWRLDGLTEADSAAIYNGLKNAGLLDADDYLIDSPRVNGWRQAIPPPYNQNDQLMRDIGNQLDNCWAEHQFYSDFNRRTIEFFNARL
jgi:dienelactone hydrolase